MRRIRRVIAPAIAVLVLATGCGGDDGDTSSGAEAPEDSPSSEETGAPARGDADLVIWTDDLKIDGVTDIAETFADTQGITVSVQAVTDLQANFVTANGAGNGPDVVVGAHDWIGNLVQNGAIEPLQLTADQLAGYSEKAVQAVTYDDKLFGVPYGIEALALYRNTDLAPDEPATLDDAIAAGQQAAKQNSDVKVPLALPVGELGDAYHMQPVLTSMGGYLFGTDADGQYLPDDLGIGKPGSLAAARKISELGETGENVLRTSVSTDNNIAQFTEGSAAFLVSGPWALPDVRNSGINYAIQPIPGFAGEKPAEPFMGAQAFMVASAAKNPAFAQEFVSTGVNNEDAMMTLQEMTGLPPAMTSVAEGLDDEDVALFTEAANQGAPMPAIPAMSAVWEPLGKAYAAIVGGANPEKTMTDTGKTIAEAIGG
jgi:arabinogalactan oligomer/maltooligosaccharide transport system substrate-binding protein